MSNVGGLGMLDAYVGALVWGCGIAAAVLIVAAALYLVGRNPDEPEE